MMTEEGFFYAVAISIAIMGAIAGAVVLGLDLMWLVT